MFTNRTTSQCVDLEHAIAPILARQCAKGVMFDREAAYRLYSDLLSAKVRLRTALQEVFPTRVVSLGLVCPKASNSKYGTRKGCEYTRIKFEEYNPSSRPQTVDRLKKQFDWNPMDFTEKGSPKLDEEIIEALPFPQVAPLKEYMMVDQRLKQLNTGKQSLMNCVKEDGRIHGSLLQSGAVTGRMIYFAPNYNIPRVDRPYGKEFRSLFRVPDGKVMIGCDADGLEARTLGGYLKKFDNGEFIKAVLEGDKTKGTDIHSMNMYAYKIEKLCEESRDCAKQLLYASIYGARNPKLGLILLTYGVNFEEYVPDFIRSLAGIKKWAQSKGLDYSDKTLECLVAGKYCRESYGEKMPALPALIKDVTSVWKANGFLKGLDGRKLFPRSEHAVFNTLNQSAGSVIMKKALQMADNELQLELKAGRDYEFVINQHDEWQLEVTDDPKIIEYVMKVLPESIKKAGEFFNFPCPMGGSAKVGKDWSECH